MQGITRQQAEQLPGALQRLFNRAPLVAALSHKIRLEGIAEAEVPLIAIGQFLSTHDRGQRADIAHAGVARIELIGQVGMILTRPLATNRVFHDTRKRGQRIDRGIDPLLIQLTVEHDLPLGDVAGQIGNRMRNIVVGHRQDRQLRNRALGGLDPATALIDLGQIGVEIARIALTTGHLAAGRGHLAQGLTVVGHIG